MEMTFSNRSMSIHSNDVLSYRKANTQYTVIILRMNGQSRKGEERVAFDWLTAVAHCFLPQPVFFFEL